MERHAVALQRPVSRICAGSQSGRSRKRGGKAIQAQGISAACASSAGAAVGTKPGARDLPWMRSLGPVFRAINARTLQFYSLLLKDVPRALAEEFLRHVEERRRRQDAPKLDRIRPGGPPRVRMPRPMRKPPGDDRSK
jgi:hypothetical protein